MTRAGRLIYVTYASGPFEANLKRNGRFARFGLGADTVLLFRRADLEADPVYHQHRQIFDTPRGAGLYAWKPWVIWKALEQAGPDDVVVYHDCGTGWRYRSFLRPRRLLDTVRRNGFLCGVRIPLYGPNRRWTTRRSLRITGADLPRVIDGETIETSISFWTRSERSLDFVRQWRDYCLIHDAVRDSTPAELAEEDPEFVQHRYDQAIATNLAWRDGAPWIECAPETLPFAKSLSLVELDLRAKTSRIYRLIWRMVIWLARSRRVIRPPA